MITRRVGLLAALTAPLAALLPKSTRLDFTKANDSLLPMTIDSQELAKRREKLRDVTRIQCSSGNWNYGDDGYMRGMANGLLVAMAAMDDSRDTPPFFAGRASNDKPGDQKRAQEFLKACSDEPVR